MAPYIEWCRLRDRHGGLHRGRCERVAHLSLYTTHNCNMRWIHSTPSLSLEWLHGPHTARFGNLAYSVSLESSVVDRRNCPSTKCNGNVTNAMSRELSLLYQNGIRTSFYWRISFQFVLFIFLTFFRIFSDNVWKYCLNGTKISKKALPNTSSVESRSMQSMATMYFNLKITRWSSKRPHFSQKNSRSKTHIYHFENSLFTRKFWSQNVSR